MSEFTDFSFKISVILSTLYPPILTKYPPTPIQDYKGIVWITLDYYSLLRYYYYLDSEENGIAELLVHQNRIGPMGTFKLSFEPEYKKFKNLK